MLIILCIVHVRAKRHRPAAPAAAIIVVVIITTFQSSCFLEKIAKVVSINCIQDFAETIAAHRIVF